MVMTCGKTNSGPNGVEAVIAENFVQHGNERIYVSRLMVDIVNIIFIRSGVDCVHAIASDADFSSEGIVSKYFDDFRGEASDDFCGLLPIVIGKQLCRISDIDKQCRNPRIVGVLECQIISGRQF